jgi:hypothetical protein
MVENLGARLSENGLLEESVALLPAAGVPERLDTDKRAPPN